MILPKVGLEVMIDLPVSSPFGVRIRQILNSRFNHHAGSVYACICK